MVAASIISALPESTPILLTTITPTGQERAKALFGNRATVTFLPFDLAWTLDRFLRKFRPRALVLVEGDYWPLLLSRLYKSETPILAVNARVGDTTFKRLRRFPSICRRLMGRVGSFGVQSPVDAKRLQVLGIPLERIQVTGNLKYEAVEPSLDSELRELILHLANDRPILLAGSTMPGEEATVVDAFSHAGDGAKAFLIVAPRHPERWNETLETLSRSGAKVGRRTDHSPHPEIDILLLDSLGELAGLYQLATAAFIGGTLSGTGGHNPLEPARFGVPTAVGPSMENFRDMARQFDRDQAWARIENGRQLGSTWALWLDNPREGRAVGNRAKTLVQSNQGALQRTLQILRPIIETNDSDSSDFL